MATADIASITRHTDWQHKSFIACITVKTMPEMLQKLIPRDVNPAFICTSYRNDMEKYNIALKLSKHEQKIVANLNSDGFKKCDTPLLYKLCQYFDFVSAPLEGWGKFDDKLQNIGDAVEAIVKLRYANISNPTGDFKERFDRMVEIANVVDKELHRNAKFEDAVTSLLVDEPPDSNIEKVKTAFQQMIEEAANGLNSSFEDDVLGEAEPICFDQEYDTDIWKKRIVLSPALFGKAGRDTNSEIDDINKLHECKQGDSKYGASNTRHTDWQHKSFIACITVKTMPEMLQKLIPRDVNPAFICTSYRNDMEKYNIALKLSKHEQKIVANLNSDGFKKCDTPLLYKLCQYFDFVSAPLEGWGKFDDKLQNIGDAVEAIVKLRYANISNPTGDFKERFDRMVEIANVVDKELHRNAKFEDAVTSLLVDEPPDSNIEKVKTAFQQMIEEAANGLNSSFEDDVLGEAEPICFDQEYDTDIWKKRIVLSPALFGKAGRDTNSEIDDINKLHECKQGDSKYGEAEPICFDQEYDTDIWKKRIVLSPALFGKAGRDTNSEIDDINKLHECKQGDSKYGEAEPICFDQEYDTDIWKKRIVLSPALFGKAGRDTNSEIDDINKLHECKQGDSKYGDVLPCSKRSLRSRKRNAMSAELGSHSFSSKKEAVIDHA